MDGEVTIAAEQEAVYEALDAIGYLGGSTPPSGYTIVRTGRETGASILLRTSIRGALR